MAKEQPAGEPSSPQPAKRRKSRAKSAAAPEAMVIVAGCSGEWVPVDELREKALAALEQHRSVTLDLDGVDHLDASSLQIVLALQVEQQARGARLELQNASAALCQWIKCAGATEHLPLA